MTFEVRQLPSNGIASRQATAPIRQPKRAPFGTGSHAGIALQRHQAVERVILAMREHIHEPLTLQTLADIATMSPYHFNRVFRQVTGIPPCQFVGALRLEQAKRLLLTTQLSVTDVCFEVGYSSLGTFTTHFRQLVGLPPSALRLLSEDCPIAFIQSLPHQPIEISRPSHLQHSLSVGINLPDPFRQTLFVGLFPTPIPQCRPSACAIAARLGTYPIERVADGSYYVLAIAFTQIDNLQTYLLPDRANVRVGIGLNPVQVSNGQFSGRVDLALRPLLLTDPPILVTLPFLLAERMALEIPGNHTGGALLRLEHR